VPAAMLVAFAAGCQAKKSENPLSPSVAGPIPGVDISAPRLLEPSQGFRFKENQQPIKLVVENSVTNGVRKLLYYFEVASDQGFANKVFARGGVPEGDGRTSVQLDALELGRAYYWRAWTDDGANKSTFSTAGFEVLPRAILTVPTAAAPVNNAPVADRRPTLRINNSSHNSAVGPVSYFFMVAKDQAFTQISATGSVGEGDVTQWTVDRELDYGLTHFWRVRATDGEITTDWSPTAAFTTLAAPAPAPPSPSPPGGGGGGSCASRNGAAIVQCIAAKYPQYRRSGVSFETRKQNMEFLRDRIIEAGLCGGLNLGYNLKRGGPEISIDFIAEQRGGVTYGYDIAFDYDNTSRVLQLQWGEDGPGSHFKGFGTPKCN
jgi:hypothetical protein